MIKLAAALLFAASVGFLHGLFFVSDAKTEHWDTRLRCAFKTGLGWSILAAVPVFFAFLFGDL